MSERASADDLLLGVDIGGTKLLAGLIDRSGQIVCRRQQPTRPNLLLPDVVAICRDLLDEANRVGRRVGGIGVGAKGSVDRETGCLVGSLYLGHGEIPMGDRLAGTFHIPVLVENDVHAATIGEMVFGIGRSVRDFLFFNAGTGIAIGLVIDGRLFRGASNTAGENGHASIDASGSWPCRCGMSGCVETMIVGSRGGRDLPRLPICDEGIPAASDRAYAYLASNLADLVALFDPGAIVLAGGMLNGGTRAVEWLAASVERWSPVSGRPTIHHAAAGRDAGLVGAAALLLAT